MQNMWFVSKEIFHCDDGKSEMKGIIGVFSDRQNAIDFLTGMRIDGTMPSPFITPESSKMFKRVLIAVCSVLIMQTVMPAFECGSIS